MDIYRVACSITGDMIGSGRDVTFMVTTASLMVYNVDKITSYIVSNLVPGVW